MKIFIDNQQPVSLIREQFNRQFPCLKLEFLPKAACQASASHNEGPCHRRIGELRQMENTGVIEVLPWMSVQELERLFRQEYGLGVQVLRRCGSIWLETAQTDCRTLSSLNAQGEADLLSCGIIETVNM